MTRRRFVTPLAGARHERIRRPSTKHHVRGPDSRERDRQSGKALGAGPSPYPSGPCRQMLGDGQRRHRRLRSRLLPWTLALHVRRLRLLVQPRSSGAEHRRPQRTGDTVSPARPRSVCSCAGCPRCAGRCPETTAQGGKCLTCKSEVKRSPEQTARKAIYNSKRWKALRRQVQRESPWCEVDGCNEPWTDLHHDPSVEECLARGLDPCDRTTVHPLCRAHHSAVTLSNTRAANS